ncbi:unnamed protein product [Paramecium octaurelia]|uniref:Uncharacterized protein n=1 Tax=Paramecium octaurelia TaxID=43137 RepID=A0A8S1Y3I6_PAROT|nr:unnamed protein product [Paramecium octaurelia]
MSKLELSTQKLVQKASNSLKVILNDQMMNFYTNLNQLMLFIFKYLIKIYGKWQQNYKQSQYI